MTRKDYIRLADLLGAAYAHLHHEAVHVQEAIHLIQSGIEDICKQDNPRFDRDRFQDAINKACWTVAGPSVPE